jgi:SPP1 family predicted phage head-tail adaptor
VWRDTVILCFKTEALDVNGNKIYTTTSKNVFCNAKSVKASEFYKAASTNLKPEIVLVVRKIDYNNEQLVKYNNKDYRVLRTFEVGENIELTLTFDVLK